MSADTKKSDKRPWTEDDDNALRYVRSLAEDLINSESVDSETLRETVARFNDRWSSLPIVFNLLEQLSLERETAHVSLALANAIEALYRIGLMRGAEAARAHQPELAMLEVAIRKRNAREAGQAEKTKPWHERAETIRKRALQTDSTTDDEAIACAIIRAWNPAFPKLPSARSVKAWVTRQRNKLD